MRIVVAEDHPDEASRLDRLLSSLGHEVRMTGTGPAALRACLDAAPGVVLLDLLLPGMDGFEVARQIRAAARTWRQVREATGPAPLAAPPPSPPVLVAITGLRSPAVDDVARSVGFAYFLRKPYTVEDLQGLMAQISAEGQLTPDSGGKR